MKRSIVVFVVISIVICSSVFGGSQPTVLEQEMQKDARAFAASPIEPFQQALLQLAFDGVSKMPLRPHIKNRSREQQHVVEACLKLNQPELARTFVGEISNWQRWMGLANLAFFYAEHGALHDAKEELEQVDAAVKLIEDRDRGRVVAVAENPLLDSLEGWRLKKVKARAYEARSFIRRLPAVQLNDMTFEEATAVALQIDRLLADSGDYEKTLASLRPYTGNQNFEIIHPALLGMVRLADDFYDSMDVSALLENEILPHFKKTPVFVRVDVLEQLAEVVLKRKDRALALALCEQMDDFIADAMLPPWLHMVEKCRSIDLKIRVGELKTARAEAAVLRDLYEEKSPLIVSIDRVVPLCRLAETFHAAGDEQAALELYDRAVNEAQVNPNSRPRAIDLGEICRSLALHKIKPTAVLMSNLNELNHALGTPW